MTKIYSHDDYVGNVSFFVNEEQYTDEELLVCIPNGYKNLFNGASFSNMADLSRAVSFARCAFEARMHTAPHLVCQYEGNLKRCFN